MNKLSKLKSKKFVIIIALIAIFIGAAIYVYNKYVAPRLNTKFVENREFSNDAIVSNDAQIFFIYAAWCPHSKKVMGHWDELKKKYNGKLVTKYMVEFVEYDGDNDEAKIDEFSKLYKKKIEGYPTIILVKENEVIEFEAEPSLENLNAFIEATL
jgi:thiol-disulfide isomerase/thioredoxin